jgi:GNAT superfamily N-acetyltransferase
MTVSTDPWPASAPDQHLRLVLVPPPVLEQLAEGHLGEAGRLSGLKLTEYQIGRECRGVWRMRLEQVAADPRSSPWVTRFLVDTTTGSAVGRAGFHGPPDARGMVEVGYAIDPVHRRRGYARAALEVLLGVAAAQPGVSVVRATISPENLASRALIEQYGFLGVGEQWDDEDGLETIFELPAAKGFLPSGAQAG